jgi:serine/threonine protein kinase
MEKQFVLGPGWKLVKKNYSITRFLGEGSYGEVVKARHRQTKEPVAIKMIKCDFENIQTCRNILREV